MGTPIGVVGCWALVRSFGSRASKVGLAQWVNCRREPRKDALTCWQHRDREVGAQALKRRSCPELERRKALAMHGKRS